MGDLAKKIACAPVIFYRKYISPHTGSHCRYYPTCSRYMLKAIEIHGRAKGVYLGVKRILRCHPWRRGGYDPAPPKKEK